MGPSEVEGRCGKTLVPRPFDFGLAVLERVFIACCASYRIEPPLAIAGLSLRVLGGLGPSEVEGYILSPSTEFIPSEVEGLGVNAVEGCLE